jgi:enoyl-CoA hydratase/carnithine racemase
LNSSSVVILLTLGLRVLTGREALGIAILRHVHGGRDNANSGHRHITVENKQIGLLHSHGNEESLAVGVIHGLAGSGGVVVALAAASPTVAGGASFLIGFSIASIVAMGVASWIWGQAIGQAHRLRILAGVASIAGGLILLMGIVGYAPTV